MPSAGSWDASAPNQWDALQRLALLIRELAQVIEQIGQNRLAESGDQSHMSRGVTPRPLLNANDLARILSVDSKTVRRWRDEGQLPGAIQIGGVVRWKHEDIEAWIDARRGA